MSRTCGGGAEQVADMQDGAVDGVGVSADAGNAGSIAITPQRPGKPAAGNVDRRSLLHSVTQEGQGERTPSRRSARPLASDDLQLSRADLVILSRVRCLWSLTGSGLGICSPLARTGQKGLIG